MSDRLAGSSWSNPILYRDWSIGPAQEEQPNGDAFGFCHDGYDSEDPLDNRCGYAASVEAAKREIDLREYAAIEPDECTDCGDAYCSANH